MVFLGATWSLHWYMCCYLDIVGDCRVFGSWISPLGLVRYCMLVVVHWWSYRLAFVVAVAVVVASFAGTYPSYAVGTGFCSDRMYY
jgi:hypothetical protein